MAELTLKPADIGGMAGLEITPHSKKEKKL